MHRTPGSLGKSKYLTTYFEGFTQSLFYKNRLDYNSVLQAKKGESIGNSWNKVITLANLNPEANEILGFF